MRSPISKRTSPKVNAILVGMVAAAYLFALSSLGSSVYSGMCSYSKCEPAATTIDCKWLAAAISSQNTYTQEVFATKPCEALKGNCDHSCECGDETKPLDATIVTQTSDNFSTLRYAACLTVNTHVLIINRRIPAQLNYGIATLSQLSTVILLT